MRTLLTTAVAAACAALAAHLGAVRSRRPARSWALDSFRARYDASRVARK